MVPGLSAARAIHPCRPGASAKHCQSAGAARSGRPHWPLKSSDVGLLREHVSNLASSALLATGCGSGTT